ncbi:N,N-dimethylformamidase beta subunit family domain-containing protein [Methylobacter luteus]|uniref:N,N-dimethylformamidase beta subunit family domain-containing protein n=1 Tax=Methylobacter luteus TaxID=415 RepID=UPI000420AC0D|nr:N,N-dimethylformamidase beta subunit family domain-containing protein [Methylobacter luteus]
MKTYDLMGYADRWSARPSDEIQFKVHCDDPRGYAVQIGRLWGPALPDEPHSSYFEAISAACNGEQPAGTQTTLCGSLAVFPPLDIDYHRGFTWFFFFRPTLLAHTCPQTLSRLCLDRGITTTLQVAANSQLELVIEHRDGLRLVPLPVKLTKEWFACGISYSLASGELILWFKGIFQGANPPFEYHLQIQLRFDNLAIATKLSVTVAGLAHSETTNLGSRQSFNGLIEYPTVFDSAMSPDQLRRISALDFAELHLDNVIASWDFSIGISGDIVFDRAMRALHGKLINQPARGVPGRTWHPDSPSWKFEPRCYAAVHFHSDDMIDAEWETSFCYTVPHNLPSGIYAARLFRDETQFYIPFVVRPSTTASCRIAFLVPTATYIAYQNHRSRYFSSANERLHGRLNILDSTDLMFIRNEQFGLSTYDTHIDGSGVYYSSASRPAFNIKPGGRLWNFAADLLIVKWLKAIDMSVDVLTDEDLDREGLPAIANYDVLFSGSHPEYVSTSMYNALEQFVSKGGSLLYLGGNGFYWRIAFHPTKRGVIEVRRTEGVRSWDAGPGCYYTSFSGERSGLWRANGKPPQKFLGVGFIGQGFDISSYYRRTSTAKTSAWAFEGIRSDILGDFGLMLGGAAGLELDAVDYELGTPEDTIILATSEKHSNIYELAIEEVLTPHGATDAILCNRIRSNIVLTRPFYNGGWVFSAGSIAFVGALAYGDINNSISRLVQNVLQRFLAQTT